MEYFFAAFIIMFIAIVLLILGISFIRQGESFQKNKRYATAVVVGYERAEKSNWYSLLIRIPELHNNNIYNCTGGRIKPSAYPKGQAVDIVYAPKKTAGITFVEAHLKDDPPADSARLGYGIRNISIAMLVIAGILIVVGMSILF